MTGPELILVRERWPHMAAVSGYDPLAMALHERVGGRCAHVVVSHAESLPHRRLTRFVGRMAGRIMGRRTQGGLASLAGNWNAVHATQRAVRLLARHPGARLLLMAGENQVHRGFLELDEDLRRRIFVVLHQPPSWLRLCWWDFRLLDGLGGVVTLCDEQAEYLDGVCTAPIIRSRHGVCVEFFSPGDEARAASDFKLVFAGAWLRDFATLTRAMEIVWQRYPHASLDCVVPQQARDFTALIRLARDPRVRWHANISADALRDLYRAASVLFLPLLDATANNALLEGMACGLPIVTTRIGGTPEYVCPEAAELCSPGDAADHAAAVLRFADDAVSRRQARTAARRHAEMSCRWAGIADHLHREITIRPAGGPRP